MKKSLTPFGETEMEVLHHVWQLDEATVRQVLNIIREDREVAYTTIMTVMKNLADKGYLTYRKEGSTYVYRPAVKPELVRSNLVEDIVKKVFGGSHKELVRALVQNENISKEERQKIKDLN